jgi:hypothetical protein
MEESKSTSFNIWLIFGVFEVFLLATVFYWRSKGKKQRLGGRGGEWST